MIVVLCVCRRRRVSNDTPLPWVDGVTAIPASGLFSRAFLKCDGFSA